MAWGSFLLALQGTIEYTLRFAFFASNNEAKYEALLIDLKLATELEVLELRVFSDSKLIVGQVCES